MKAQIRVGDVEVAVAGLNLTLKDVRQLLRAAASIAVALTPDPPEPSQPVGFTAHVERGSDPPPENYYTDDED